MHLNNRVIVCILIYSIEKKRMHESFNGGSLPLHLL